MSQLQSLVCALWHSIVDTPVRRENELCNRVLEHLPGAEKRVTHPIIRDRGGRPRNRQGERPNCDFAIATREGGWRLAGELKLVKRPRFSFYANEFCRDINRQELLAWSDYAGFHFKPIILLAGNREIMEALWIKNPTMRALLPCPFGASQTVPFSVDMFALYRRFVFDRTRDPLKDTWSYFSAARVDRRATIANFGDRIPLAKSILVSAWACQADQNTAVCGFQLSAVGANLFDERELDAWRGQRFVVQ